MSGQAMELGLEHFENTLGNLALLVSRAQAEDAQCSQEITQVVMAYLDQLDGWLRPRDNLLPNGSSPQISLVREFERSLEIFGLPPGLGEGDLLEGQVLAQVTKAVERLKEIIIKLDVLCLITKVASSDTPEGLTIRRHLSAFMTFTLSFENSLSCLLVSSSVRLRRDLTYVPENLLAALSIYGQADQLSDKFFIQVLNYLYQRTMICQYRRRDDRLYRQRFIHNGQQATHCWEPACTIAEFVLKEVSCDRNKVIYNLYNSVPTFHDRFVRALQEQHNSQLPLLEPNRFVFAYDNGLYDAERELFLPWGDPRIDTKVAATRYFDQNFPIAVHQEPPRLHTPLRFLQLLLRNASFQRMQGHDADKRRVHELFEALQRNAPREPTPAEHEEILQICQRLSVDPMPMLRHPFHIPTPKFASIMRSQNFSATVQLWLFVFMGRMLYPLRMHDNWQVAPFFKGQGETGKSTIMEIVRRFFQEDDVGILSAAVEPIFGLWPLMDKYVVMIMEMKSKFNLNQGDFQSMISGEGVSVAKKNQIAKKIIWKAPMMIAGNESGPWVDTSDSISRRQVIFNFHSKVTTINPNLLNEIQEEELGLLLLKSNMIYRNAARTYHMRGIWDILPQYFKDTRRQYKADVNPLYEFVQKGPLSLGRGHWMLYDDFLKLFREYCRIKGRATFQVTLEQQIPIFEEFGLSVAVNILPVPPTNQPTQGNFLIGACPQEERLSQENYLLQNNHQLPQMAAATPNPTQAQYDQMNDGQDQGQGQGQGQPGTKLALDMNRSMTLVQLMGILRTLSLSQGDLILVNSPAGNSLPSPSLTLPYRISFRIDQRQQQEGGYGVEQTTPAVDQIIVRGLYPLN